MPQFKYTAVDSTGKKITKIMVANNKTEVVTYLTTHQFVVVHVDNVTNQALKQSKKITLADKIFFTQNISVLLASGISLGEALKLIAEDTASKSTSAFYESLRVDLERGYPLSAALANYPDVFDTVYISLIKAGEASGELSAILESLSKNLEEDARIRAQVRSALLYPGFILASLFVLTMMIVFFVLPRITKIFAELDVELPITTRIMVGFADFVNKQPFVVIGIIVALGVSGYFFAKSKTGKKFASTLGFYMPFVKQITYNSDLLHLTTTLALLLNAGVPIQEAIGTSAGTVKNVNLNLQLIRVSKELATGKALGDLLRTTTLPKTFVALVATGEKSGNITLVFQKLSEHYQNLLNTAIKNFTGIIEPVLTLAVGIIVGGVVLSIMLPIYQFIGNLETVR